MSHLVKAFGTYHGFGTAIGVFSVRGRHLHPFAPLVASCVRAVLVAPPNHALHLMLHHDEGQCVEMMVVVF
jgi:hypothetical protein